VGGELNALLAPVATNPSMNLNLALEKELGAKAELEAEGRREPLKAFPLGMVLQAWPEITMYGPDGSVSNRRDLMAAAVVVRSMLGVSPSAYQDGDVMGRKTRP